jgi:hypothetical protein
LTWFANNADGAPDRARGVIGVGGERLPRDGSGDGVHATTTL